jgi:hypothetical protein
MVREGGAPPPDQGPWFGMRVEHGKNIVALTSDMFQVDDRFQDSYPLLQHGDGVNRS